MVTPDSWPLAVDAAAFFDEQLSQFLCANPFLRELSNRFLAGAGIRLGNLVDHWRLPYSSALANGLEQRGLVGAPGSDNVVYKHPLARLPKVLLYRAHIGEKTERLSLVVEDVDRFISAHSLNPSERRGNRQSAYEEAVVELSGAQLGVVARRGSNRFVADSSDASKEHYIESVRTLFRSRKRELDEAQVIDEAIDICCRATQWVGQARAADEFFEAEREYYVSRNTAARWQFAQQQRFGLGWANHDHHTYRSSRAGFRALLKLWKTLGFSCRERYHAGSDAGWGAQILEHPVSRVVIFSDVDMTDQETLAIDFENALLPDSQSLGTIGLWCGLHGSSIARAGMHHLECEFDFEQARARFETAGFGVMPPFTDLPMLKQAFTLPEIWQVRPEKIDTLKLRGWITPEEAERFLTHGANGSHLEILQRWDGFKGFNKTGVSQVIRDTDARKAPSA